MKPENKKSPFTRYQVFIIALLAILQFTIVLDFMVMSPLGALVMPDLGIGTEQFSLVVAAYAISAGISGFLASAFADKFDRKKFLLFFYCGFVIGTFLCGIATDFEFLFAARIVTGIFGGVIGSVSFAIITDLFAMEVRGRVMGFVQMAFALGQALGLPVGVKLAGEFGWRSPFLMIVGLSILVGVMIVIYMKPVSAHLALQTERNPFRHMKSILSRREYLIAFASTTLLATGGFMLMPFGSDFAVNNLGLDFAHDMFLIYLITGISTMIFGPLIGKFSDKTGKYKTFIIGSLVSLVIVVYYCQLGVSPLWWIIVLNAVLMISITSRMISSSALMTAVPDPKDRGTFMGINSSFQQISGGFAAMIAGNIVVKTSSGKLENYDVLGYVVAVAILITIAMLYPVNKFVERKMRENKAAVQPIAEVPAA